MAWRLTCLDVTANFLWRHNELVDVIACLWRHGELFASWRVLDVMACFWRYDELYNIITCFWLNDKLFALWCVFDVLTKHFWRHTVLFEVVTYFDIMTILLTSWGTCVPHDVFLTSRLTLWRHNVFLTSCLTSCFWREHFGVMMYFIAYDLMSLRSFHTFRPHYVFVITFYVKVKVTENVKIT